MIVTKRPFVVVLALTIALSVAPLVPAQSVIRVGSWNIKLLGSQMPAQKAEDLAKYIAFAKVDLLAVQEITPTAPAPAGFAAPFESSKILTDVCKHLNKLDGGTWKHVLFPAFYVDLIDGKKQWTEVVWNDQKVQSKGSPVKFDVSNDAFQTGKDKDFLWKRNAYAMMFTAGKDQTDFVLVPLHMKSNRGKGNYRPHREAEAKALVNKLPDLNKTFPGEKDLVLLGDTNFLKDENGLVETALKVFEDVKLKDLNASNEGTYRGTAPFDRFLVPTNQPEFKQSSQKVIREFLKQEGLKMDQFASRYSDHLMIVMEIQIAKDDD